MTGTNDNRPDFQRMLKDSAKKNWNYVLVYKKDRFSRNKFEMATHKNTLKQNGVKVSSVTKFIPEGPEGIILERVCWKAMQSTIRQSYCKRLNAE